MTRRVVIIGGGIVGASIADGLSRHAELDVTVIERGPDGRLLGSTGHAPGFVSELSESSALTALAVASTNLYAGIESGTPGFERVGGLEVAVSESALANLERRSRMAATLGVEARLLEAHEALALAPAFVDRETCLGGLIFPRDGAARGTLLTGALMSRAERGGVSVRHGTGCREILTRGERVTGLVTSSGDVLDADDVVVAAGIWGSEVAAQAGIDVRFTSISHPYVYGPARDSAPSATRQPFAKWRSETVYARDHGDRLGIGTHTNNGPAVNVADLGEAELPWSGEDFEQNIEAAMQLLPEEHRFPVETRLNGLFSMTADGLPLVGATSVQGLWVAVSLWLTHAGGAAAALVDLMTGGSPAVDGLDAMHPERFAGQDDDRLEALSLNNYRKIWMPADQPAERD